MDRGQYQKAGTLGKLVGAGYDVFCRMTLYLLAANRREGLAYTCEEQSQIFVNLCRCTYGRTRVARNYTLLNGNRWRKSLDEVILGLAHSSQELTGITGERLYITALSFGIERIESQ